MVLGSRALALPKKLSSLAVKGLVPNQCVQVSVGMECRWLGSRKGLCSCWSMVGSIGKATLPAVQDEMSPGRSPAVLRVPRSHPCRAFLERLVKAGPECDRSGQGWSALAAASAPGEALAAGSGWLLLGEGLLGRRAVRSEKCPCGLRGAGAKGC